MDMKIAAYCGRAAAINSFRIAIDALAEVDADEGK
jgi:hypothetical protein